MIVARPDAIRPPAPLPIAMLMVRSPRQQAQAIELIHALAGAREARRWQTAIRNLEASEWGWMTGFSRCAQRILGVGARRNRLLRGFAVDCALQTWRQVPLQDCAEHWLRPWRTSRQVLAAARTAPREKLPDLHALASRDARWVYRKMGTRSAPLRRLYRATKATKAACHLQAGRAAQESASQAARREESTRYLGWFLSRLLAESDADWLDRTGPQTFC